MNGQDFTTEGLLEGRGIYSRGIYKSGANTVISARPLTDAQRAENEASNAKDQTRTYSDRAEIFERAAKHDQAEAEKHTRLAGEAKASGDKIRHAYHSNRADAHAKSAAKGIKDASNARQQSQRWQVSAQRASMRAAAGVKAPSGNPAGGQEGHPFYGNQHVSR